MFQDWLFICKVQCKVKMRDLCGEIIAMSGCSGEHQNRVAGLSGHRPHVTVQGYTHNETGPTCYDSHFIEPLGKLTEVKMDYNGQEETL